MGVYSIYRLGTLAQINNNHIYYFSSLSVQMVFPNERHTLIELLR